jgi:hypothetical protein
VYFALEGCTGWRNVTGELAAAGIIPHLAEPADTAALPGRKRHAKTDKTDPRHLRAHLLAGDLPECWIPPGHVPEAQRVRVQSLPAAATLPFDRQHWANAKGTDIDLMPTSPCACACTPRGTMRATGLSCG